MGADLVGLGCCKRRVERSPKLGAEPMGKGRGRRSSRGGAKLAEAGSERAFAREFPTVPSAVRGVEWPQRTQVSGSPSLGADLRTLAYPLGGRLRRS